MRGVIGRRGVMPICTLALTLWAFACAGPREGRGLGAEGDFQHAQSLFESGKYFAASTELEAFRSRNPGSDRVDDATYYLGLTHMKLDEHLLAQQEFDRLLSDYPTSTHREDAEFQRAMSFYQSAYSAPRDPEPIEAALGAFEAYRRHYPSGTHVEEAARLARACQDRLAVKHFLNGETYLQLGQARGAVLYFEKSLSMLKDSSRAADAHLGLARAHAAVNQVEKAREEYQRTLDYITPERLAAEPRLADLRGQAEIGLRSLSTEAP